MSGRVLAFSAPRSAISAGDRVGSLPLSLCSRFLPTKQSRHINTHSLIGLIASRCPQSGPIPPADPVRSQPAHTPPAGKMPHVPPHTPTARHRPGAHPAANSLPPPGTGEEVCHGHLRPRPVHDPEVEGQDRKQGLPVRTPLSLVASTQTRQGPHRSTS